MLLFHVYVFDRTVVMVMFKTMDHMVYDLMKMMSLMMCMTFCFDHCQVFQQFDCEGESIADVKLMLDFLKKYNGSNLFVDLNSIIRTFQSCSYTPGIVIVILFPINLSMLWIEI